MSLPRKLCAPHFAHAQSPCFHFSDASLSPFPFPFPAGDCAALPFGLFGTRTFFFFLATPSVATAVAASAGFCFALALFGVLGFLLFSLAMVLPHSARCRVLRGISGGGGYFLQSSEQTAGKMVSTSRPREGCSLHSLALGMAAGGGFAVSKMRNTASIARSCTRAGQRGQIGLFCGLQPADPPRLGIGRTKRAFLRVCSPAVEGPTDPRRDLRRDEENHNRKYATAAVGLQTGARRCRLRDW